MGLYKSIMATLAGFEPRVFALRMQRPEPLDEKVKRSHYSDKNKILDKIPAAVQAQIVYKFKSRRGIDKIYNVNFIIYLNLNARRSLADLFHRPVFKCYGISDKLEANRRAAGASHHYGAEF